MCNAIDEIAGPSFCEGSTATAMYSFNIHDSPAYIEFASLPLVKTGQTMHMLPRPTFQDA